jgi:hypothetical protein
MPPSGQSQGSNRTRFYSDPDYDYGYWDPGAGYVARGADTDLALRTVVAEARSQGEAGMAAVAGVINNRSKGTGKSVGQIVQEPHQFEPWSNPRTRAWMMALPTTSLEYQKAAAVALPIFAGQTPDPTHGATMFYSPKAQAALGRGKPVFDDGSGVPIGGQLYFQGDYRRTHPRGKPAHFGAEHRFPPSPQSGGLFDPSTFPPLEKAITDRTHGWPNDGSAGPRPPLR